MFVFLAVFVSIILLGDFYFFQATKSLLGSWSGGVYVKVVYWLTTAILLIAFVTGFILYMNRVPVSGQFRVMLQGVIFCLFIPRLFALGFFVLDDVIRGVKFFISKLNPEIIPSAANGISRSKFLQLAGLGTVGVFTSIFTYGIVKGAYNFNVIKQKLKLKNLPKAFKGVKIVQISDLHVGSFFSKDPLEKAVELINDQDPDYIFFTGDLVNEIAEEAEGYVPVLSKLKAKYGMFSILGNHDYGDYFYTVEQKDLKKRNKQLMKQYHDEIGFKLLLDESVQLKRGEEEISVVGIENWGAKGKFPQYGKLEEAIKGTENSAVKLLLSHDPSHWEAEVLKNYKDIDATFSGHTHGMQFGIEIPGFKWSPVKWMYKQWAGLYKKDGQQLYVNRGLGFVGYPGRVGISPEITVFELAEA